ncbi:MAG: hypothetical protein QOE97_3661 [Pseudonocardiales bacterium]|jgi:hypothetical protein|nr:hypothetical protein [Pseudonocardiales bacterium]
MRTSTGAVISVSPAFGSERSGQACRTSPRRVAVRVLCSLRAVPLTAVLVIGLLVSAGLLDTNPGDLAAVVSWTSTNLHNLARHPVAAMLASVFIVPGAQAAQIVIIAGAGAALERRIGVARTVLVALSGQVLATLLTEYGADVGAHLHLWASSAADRPDVGVSYLMFSVLAASCLLLTGRARALGVAATGAGASILFLLSPGMTSTGHLLSIALGLAAMQLARRHRRATGPVPVRPPQATWARGLRRHGSAELRWTPAHR